MSDQILFKSTLQCLEVEPIKKLDRILFIPQIVNGKSVILNHREEQKTSVTYEESISRMNYNPDTSSMYGHYRVFEYGIQEKFSGEKNLLTTDCILSDISLLSGVPLGAIGLIFTQMELGDILSPATRYLSPDTLSSSIKDFGVEMDLILNKPSELMQFEISTERRNVSLLNIYRVLVFKNIA